MQAGPRDLDSRLSLSRRLETNGFHALLMGDHPDSGASPWPALGAAAAVTQTLQLGTYVLQAGVREPVHASSDAATLESKYMKAKKRVLALLIALTSLASGCGLTTNQTPEEVTEAFVGNNDGGAIVLVQHDGEVTRTAVGDANADGDPLTIETPMRVGSISKTFVATMVLQLVDEGLVDLDEPLGTYLPQATTGSSVSIRQLLSHRSGIASYTVQPSLLEDVMADRARSFTPEQILGYVADLPQETPGEYAYSNTNYILLGQVIEQLDGTDLNQSLQTRIAEPLGLDSTLFPTAGAATETVASGWSPGFSEGQADAEYEALDSGAWAAGALISTVDDLAAFLHGLFAGDLITDASLEQMTDTGLDGYGLGIVTAVLGPRFVGFSHGGATLGYRSTMAIQPFSGDSVVILTNNDDLNADHLAPKILEASRAG